MTGNKVQVLLEKYGKQVPPNMLFEFKNKLLEAEEEDFDVIYKCYIKDTLSTVLFAVFLGGFGIDRFYIGDVAHGVGKLAATVFSNMLSIIFFFNNVLWLGIVTLLVYIATVVWLITDIFFSYKKCRYKNFLKVMQVILDKNGQYLDNRILEIVSE